MDRRRSEHGIAKDPHRPKAPTTGGRGPLRCCRRQGPPFSTGSCSMRMELRQEQTYPEPTCQQGRGGERWPKTQPLHPITRRIRGAHTGPRNSTRDGRKLGWIGGNLDGEGGGGVLESPKSLGQDPIFLGQALCQDTHLAVPN
jgi:hypothetical protein